MHYPFDLVIIHDPCLWLQNDTCWVNYELCILALSFIALELNITHKDDCSIKNWVFRVVLRSGFGHGKNSISFWLRSGKVWCKLISIFVKLSSKFTNSLLTFDCAMFQIIKGTYQTGSKNRLAEGGFS